VLELEEVTVNTWLEAVEQYVADHGAVVPQEAVATSLVLVDFGAAAVATGVIPVTVVTEVLTVTDGEINPDPVTVNVPVAAVVIAPVGRI